MTLTSQDGSPDHRPSTEFLLIGADGLVGRHIRDALLGHSFVATYRHGPGPAAVGLDVTDDDAVRRIVERAKPRVIVLAAAQAHVERCEREPEASRRVNVEAGRVLAEAARGVGALLIVFSSEYVFDGAAGRYSEDDERAPLNEYGRQKVALEDIALSGRGLVCRTSGVFGADPRRKDFVHQLVDRLRGGGTFNVPSDQVVTPTYAPALARAVVELALQERTGIYHVAGPRVLPRARFAEMVCDAYGLPPARLAPLPTAQLGLAAPRPLRCGLRVDKLLRTIGHGLTDPEEALRMSASHAPAV